jgi:hypothetical protein
MIRFYILIFNFLKIKFYNFFLIECFNFSDSDYEFTKINSL